MRSRGSFRHMTMRSGIPEDVWGSGARVTMTGKRCVLVEGHQGVVELSPDRIRLRTEDGVVSILGEGLEVQELSVDAALIFGGCIDTVTRGK